MCSMYGTASAVHMWSMLITAFVVVCERCGTLPLLYVVCWCDEGCGALRLLYTMCSKWSTATFVVCAGCGALLLLFYVKDVEH